MLVRVRVRGWVRVTVELGTSSAFRGWVKVRVLGCGFRVRGSKVKSRDCALESDLFSKSRRNQVGAMYIVDCTTAKITFTLLIFNGTSYNLSMAI